MWFLWGMVILVIVVSVFVPLYNGLFGDFDWSTMTNGYEKENVFSKMGKGWLIFVLICIFAGVAMTGVGFAISNGVIGASGIVLWLIASVIGAYSCSPLRLINAFDLAEPRDMAQGCAGMLMTTMISLLDVLIAIAMMLSSWFFIIRMIPKR